MSGSILSLFAKTDNEYIIKKRVFYNVIMFLLYWQFIKVIFNLDKINQLQLD